MSHKCNNVFLYILRVLTKIFGTKNVHKFLKVYEKFLNFVQKNENNVFLEKTIVVKLEKAFLTHSQIVRVLVEILE